VARNTRNNRRNVGGIVFCTARVVSKESLWVCLCIPLSLLGNGSVNTFPRQRKIVGGFVFYAVRVVSKESRRLVLSRTSCLIIRQTRRQILGLCLTKSTEGNTPLAAPQSFEKNVQRDLIRGHQHFDNHAKTTVNQSDFTGSLSLYRSPPFS
jgi:hypothetical protein